VSASPDLAARLRCLSWGFAALRGHTLHALGRLWVPPLPFDVQRPAGLRPWSCRPAEACQRPSMRFRAPSEDDLRESARPRTVPAACATLAIPGFASSPGLSSPYGTVSAWWTRMLAVDPSTAGATCEVWLPPSRRTPLGLATPGTFRRRTPPNTSSALERPWATLFTVFPSTASGTPFGAAALMPLPPASPLRPRAGSVGRQSPSGPCSRGESVQGRCVQGQAPIRSRRRSRLEVSFSPEHAPARSGSRFGRGASPHTLGWGDVPIHLGLRVSGRERVGGSVSGPPALVRFFTFQQTMLRPLQQEGRPTNWMWAKHGAAGIAVLGPALPSRSRPASAPGHCCPVACSAHVGSDKCFGSTTSHCRAATDPGPVARHRHSSVHN
jgi:hypothetical protein